MKDIDISWRVIKLEDGSARLEVYIDGEKIGEQGFVRQLENLLQGMSCQRYQDPHLR